MFTDKQLNGLLAKIEPRDPRIKKQDGNLYIPTHEVIDTLNALIGLGMWDFEVRDLRCSYCDTRPGKVDPQTGAPRSQWVVVYLAAGRLTVRDQFGAVSVHEDVGVGEAVQSDKLPPPHDMASKAAVSGALKRCARHFGNQFGNSLYDKEDVSGTGAANLDQHFAAANEGTPSLQPASQPPAASIPAPASPPAVASPAPAAPSAPQPNELLRDQVEAVVKKIVDLKKRSGGQHPAWVVETFELAGHHSITKSAVEAWAKAEPTVVLNFERRLDKALAEVA